jgi:thioredoxin-related protein
MKTILIIMSLLLSAQCLAFGDKPFNKSYDPTRDPFDDFQMAQADARANNTLILVVLGGEWCSWCHKLSAFIKNSKEAGDMLHDTFTVMKVNVSENNYNDEFTAQLPEAQGYPFFVIVAPSGEVLGSADTANFEKGESYSEDEFKKFIKRWKE